jgi:hypothetical protein
MRNKCIDKYLPLFCFSHSMIWFFLYYIFWLILMFKIYLATNSFDLVDQWLKTKTSNHFENHQNEESLNQIKNFSKNRPMTRINFCDLQIVYKEIQHQNNCVRYHFSPVSFKKVTNFWHFLIRIYSDIRFELLFYRNFVFIWRSDWKKSGWKSLLLYFLKLN